MEDLYKHYLPAFLTFLLEISYVLYKWFDYDDNQMLKIINSTWVFLLELCKL